MTDHHLQPKAARRSRITTPARAHPFAKLVFREMNRQNVTYFELEMRAGVLTSTLKAWRTENSPGLPTIESALGALDWALVPVPKLASLPEGVRDKLEEVAEHFETDEQVFGAVVQTMAEMPRYNATHELMGVQPRPQQALTA